MDEHKAVELRLLEQTSLWHFYHGVLNGMYMPSVEIQATLGSEEEHSIHLKLWAGGSKWAVNNNLNWNVARTLR